MFVDDGARARSRSLRMPEIGTPERQGRGVQTGTGFDGSSIRENGCGMLPPGEVVRICPHSRSGSKSQACYRAPPAIHRPHVQLTA